MTKETDEYGKINEYKYNVDGNLLSHKNPDGKTIQYAYDKFNNIKQVKDANGKTISYTWDIFGNKTSITYKNTSIKYEYNEMNKVTKVSKGITEIASYSYDQRGNAATLKNGNATTAYTYDKLNRKLSAVTKKGNKEIGNYQYVYDGTGNILSETINGKENTYAYDEMDELKESTKFINGKQVKITYGYDLYGNKTEVSTNGEFKRYHYNDNNELTNIYTKEGNTDIYYDKNGNMRDILYAGGAKDHYDYDEFGQLKKVTNSKDQSFEFEYDAEGDRIHYKKNVKDDYDDETWYKSLEETEFADVKDLLEDKNSTQTFDALRYQAQYHIDNKTCVLMPEYDDSDWYAKDVSYVLDKTFENSEILATDDGEINIYGQNERLMSDRQSRDGTSKATRYLNGNNNSVYAKLETEMTWYGPKENVKEIEYSDFGFTDDMKSGFGYNGEVLDDDGLIYLRARYYNPQIGQFIQLDENRGDIENVESQNRYAFAMQNPNKYIDKDGRMAIMMSDGGGSRKGLFGGITNLAETVKKEAKKAFKKKKTSSDLTSQDRYNLWNGSDSWDNWGGKPKGVYATKADYKQDHPSANNVAEEKPKEQACPGRVEPVSSMLDGVQKILDVIGFIPGLGDIADGINAVISFLRANYLDAIISVGCIVFSVFGDTLLKPLKWAAGTLVQKVSKIAKKISGFLPSSKSFISGISNTVQNIWFIGKKIKTAVKNACDGFINKLDSLFREADNLAYAGVSKEYLEESGEDAVNKIIVKETSEANESSLKYIYDSIKKSPQYPKGFKDVVNGTQKVVVKDKKLLSELRKVEAGQWKKVYKDGYDGLVKRFQYIISKVNQGKYLM